MFQRTLKLFNLFGFQVKADISLLILSFLVIWSLAAGYFPAAHPGLSGASYFWMGVVGLFGLFLSIVVHEFAHSIVARQFGLPMKGITLFIFGGVAEMSEEPQSAKAEFFMAIAGPITSFLIGAIFVVVTGLALNLEWPAQITEVTRYLGALNFLLGVFNLLPGYPLDGGRVLRSALWAWKRDIHWATRVASSIGAGFGIGLVVLGIFAALSGNPIAGMWWLLIGLFLRGAAKSSYQQLLFREYLEGESIDRFVKGDPVTVPPSLTVRDLVEGYFYKYYHKLFPVRDSSGRLVGCVSSSRIRQIEKGQWDTFKVRDVMEECGEVNTVGAGERAHEVFRKMTTSGRSRFLVVRGADLVGVVTLKDLLSFLAFKMELEGEDSRPGRQVPQAGDEDQDRVA